MKAILPALALCLFALPALAAAEPQTPAAQQPLRAIASLDLPRYMGTWHEIARYPNWFQEKCTGETFAEYSLREDGKVRVVNRCRLADGELSEAIGTARQLGKPDSPRLEVRFAPAWLSFLPFVWGDYWVIDLDEDYQLVAVSEPKREYLWVLARTPRVDADAYARLLQRLERQGFDTDRLKVTHQK